MQPYPNNNEGGSTLKTRCMALLLISLAALLLVGCKRIVKVYAYADESWRVQQILSYQPDAIPSLGFGFEGININTNLGFTMDEFIQFGLDQTVGALEMKGLKASWNRREVGNQVTYTIQTEGAGWQSLQDWGLGGDPTSLAAWAGDISGEYSEYLDALAGSVVVEPLPDGWVRLSISPLPEIEAYTSLGFEFEVHAAQFDLGRTNTRLIQGGTATWKNTNNIQAVFLPAASLGDSKTLVIAIGSLLVVVVAGLGAYKLLASSRRLANRPDSFRTPRRPARTTPRPIVNQRKPTYHFRQKR